MRKFTAEEKEEIKGHFDYFDQDENGQLDVEEFTKLLQTIAPEATEAEGEQGFKDIDTDDSGLVDFNEFLDWWAMNWSVF